MYAQVRRIQLTTIRQLEFVAESHKMIWLTVHRSLLPSTENLGRMSPLSSREVRAATSFYYLYQEQTSFLIASAMEAFKPDQQKSIFNIDLDVIGFDYATQGRKDALNKRLSHILREAIS